MGDQQFFEFLRRYLAADRFNIATTRDFLQLAEEVGGKDLSPLHDEWLQVPDRD
jgi:aminopeptidase N